MGKPNSLWVCLAVKNLWEEFLFITVELQTQVHKKQEKDCVSIEESNYKVYSTHVRGELPQSK